MSDRTILNDGIHDLTNEQYHAASGISRSQLMLLDKSPYHFWYEVLSGEALTKESTPSMNIGSAFHTLLLEPDLFDSEYAVIPNIDRRTKQGKEDYKVFVEESEGKILLTKEQYDKAKTMSNLVKKHDIVHTLLDDAVFEKSIFWTDKETGLQFKSRPDIWAEKMVVDIKTTNDATPSIFRRSALNYGYYLQAGMAYEGCKSIGKPFEMFVILACEKEPPYAPAVFMMSDDALQFGIDQFQSYKKILAECLEKDNWDGYPVEELTVPEYAIKQFQSNQQVSI